VERFRLTVWTARRRPGDGTSRRSRRGSRFVPQAGLRRSALGNPWAAWDRPCRPSPGAGRLSGCSWTLKPAAWSRD